IFTSNVSITYSSYGGAVIYLTNGNIYNCTFLFNQQLGADYGGVIVIGSGTIESCLFIGNIDNNTQGLGGGAIYASSNTNITNCIFSNNKATLYGGGILMNSGFVSN